MLDWFLGWHPSELWLVVAMALLMLELVIPTFFIGSFGVSSLVAAGLAGLGLGLEWQITSFAVVGAALVFPARRFFLKQSPELKMATDSLEGQRGLCVEPIDGDLKPGAVRLGGTRWTAVTESGQRVAQGQAVTIIRRDGVKLVVLPAPSNEQEDLRVEADLGESKVGQGHQEETP